MTRSIDRGIALVLLLGAWCNAADAAESALFSEGFESYEVGALPSGYVIVFNGLGTAEQHVAAEGGQKHLRTAGQRNWSLAMRRDFDDDLPGTVSASVRMRVDNDQDRYTYGSDGARYAHFGSFSIKNSDEVAAGISINKYEADGKVVADCRGEGTRHEVQLGEWTTFRLEVDFAAGRQTLYADDVQFCVADTSTVDLSGQWNSWGDPSGIHFGSGNSGNGPSVTRYDDIEIRASASDRQGTALLFEDWESGEIDRADWTLYGWPQSQVVAFGDRQNVFDNNGDGGHNSGVLTSAALALREGSKVSIAADFYIDYTNRGGCWMGVQLGLVLDADVDEQELASRDPSRMGLRHGIFDGCGAANPEDSRKVWFRGGGIRDAQGDWVGVPEFTLSAEDYVGGWHRLAVEIDESNQVSFHVDGKLLWESDVPIDAAYRTARLLVGGRSSGNAGKAYMDNIEVSVSDGSDDVGEPPDTPPDYAVHLVPRADDPVRQGFVRVINRAATSGEVRIDAYDDEGNHRGPVTLAIAGNETVHFNSDDLEAGNTQKGLSGRTGAGIGDWRLELRTDLDIEPLAYIRTTDGFLTAMHDAAPATGNRHRIAIFNPGRNTNQVSRLRLVNPGQDDVNVAITARDDGGRASRTELDVPAGKSRTLTAQELEAGARGLARGIGAGAGKWELNLDASGPIVAMSLLESPTGHLTNLCTVPTATGRAHTVPLFPAKSPSGRQGFVRVVNRSGSAAEAEITAFDDQGAERGPLTLAVPAGGAVHFNSDDLEDGNAAKGLTRSTGSGSGDWRLEIASAVDIDVLAYVRTADGFLTAMHDTAPTTGNRHEVAIFNPGGNRNQVSTLRLVNPTGRAATATVRGTDDLGAVAGEVRVPIAARGARTVTAQQLESGSGVSGALGDGTGKWRLEVESTEPIIAMSLLESPTGHLTNLSSVPSLAAPETAAELFATAISGPVVQSKCVDCHVSGGEAGSTRLIFVTDVVADHEAANLRTLRDFVANVDNGGERILAKIRGGENHGGGVQVAAGTADYANMARLVALLGAEGAGPAVALAGPLVGARVVVHELADASRIVHETTTDGNGRLFLPADVFRGDLHYLVEAAGGRDADGASNGRLRALLTRAQLLSSATIVSVLTDIAWRHTRVKPGEFGVADNLMRLTDVARVLIREDLDGDGVVDHRDLATFDPRSDRAALAFDYDDLADRDRFDDRMSVLDAYRAMFDTAAEDALDAKLYAVFAGRLSPFAPPDSRATSVTVTLVPFGDGEVRSADGRLAFHPDAETTSADLVRVYPRGSATLRFEATPQLGSRVLGWNGCDELADSLSACTVSLHEDRSVEVMFGYESATVADDFANLTAAWSRMAEDGTLTVATGDDALATTIRGLRAGSLIVAAASGPRRVQSVRETGTRRFELQTTAASLEDIILEGTVHVTKALTEGDLVEPVGTSAAAPQLPTTLPSSSGAGRLQPQPHATFSSDYEGVSLIRSGNPSSTRFVIEVGAGAARAADDIGIGVRCGEGGVRGDGGCSVTIKDANGNEATVSGRIVVDRPRVDFAASWGLFRGLEYIKAVPRMEVTQELTVDLGKGFDILDASERLVTFTLPTITVPVGPVPVVLTPTFEIHVGIAGGVRAEVRATAKLTQSLRAGFVYRKGQGADRIWDYDRQWVFTAPQLNFEGEVKPYIQVEAPVYIYGAAGPSVFLKGSVRLKGTVGLESTDTPECRVNAGIQASLGLEMGVALKVRDEVGSILGDLVGANVTLSLEYSEPVAEVPIFDFEAGGFCEPHLAVDGDSIFANAYAGSRASVEGNFTLSNTSAGSMPWSVRLDAGCPLAPPTSGGGDNPVLRRGTLGGDESTDVYIALEAARLNPGEHRCTLTFSNDHYADRSPGDRPPDTQTGTVERTVSVFVTWPLSKPRAFAAEVSADGERVVLTWDHGACAFDSTARGIYQGVHGFQIARATVPDNPDSWEGVFFQPAFSSPTVGTECRFDAPLRSPDIVWERDRRYHFRVFATGEEQSASASTSVHVPPVANAPSFAATLANQTLEVGRRMTPLPLPMATDGDAPVTYSLRPVPLGLHFDPATRVLSGTPLAAVGTEYAMTYAATDADGDATARYFVIRLTKAGNDTDDEIGQTFVEGVISTGLGGLDSVSVLDLDVVDVDGDGDLDVLSGWGTNMTGDYFRLVNEDRGGVTWHENTGRGSAFRSHRWIGDLPDGGRPEGDLQGNVVESVRGNDMDGDGDIDVVFTYFSNANANRGYGPKSGWVVWSANLRDDASRGVLLSGPAPALISACIAVADSDADGDMDVLAVINDVQGDRRQWEAVWYRNDGVGVFSPHWRRLGDQIHYFFTYCKTPLVGDLDNDGDADVVLVTDDLIAGLPRAGGFQLGWQGYIHIDNADAVVDMADVDGDGDPDFVVGGNEAIRWYENQQDGASFVRHAILPGVAVRTVRAADMDLDGDTDVVFVSGNRASWIENNGGGMFLGSKEYGGHVGPGAVSLRVGDMDGDGDPDIIHGTTGDNRVAWQPNRLR